MVKFHDDHKAPLRIRLNAAERRRNLIAAARSLFAERGFDGATTRELAERADVSEALLFKYFKNKAAIYKAMLDDCKKSEVWTEASKLLKMKPSTSTLAAMFHFIAVHLTSGDEDMRTSHRLLLRSMGGDGEYARVIFQHIDTEWIGKMRACARAANRAGDMPGGASAPVFSWLSQHVFMMLALTHASEDKCVDYGTERGELVRQAVIFCLRGMGVGDDAIERAYNPDAYSLFANSNFKIPSPK